MSDNGLLGAILANDEESCPQPKTVFPANTPLAMAYIPFQQWEKPYEPETALSRGTIFPALDQPFLGEEAVRNADIK